MNAALHPEAVAELREAADWYERQAPGLGDKLLQEVEAAIHAILEAPGRWPIVDEVTGTRGYLIKRFPYRLHYRTKGDVLQIIAIVHGHREPDYWRQRR